MNHYVYKITNGTTGEYYIGKRSCPLWQRDQYMGSGKLLKRKMKAHRDHKWRKEVLGLYASAEEAYAQEALILGDLWLTDPLCLNLKPGGMGSALTEGDLITRKELQGRWERGEDLGRLYVELSNDKLGRKTRVRSTERALIEQLLALGFQLGDSVNYPYIALSSLGLTAQTTPAERVEAVLRGENPHGSDVLWLSNSASRLRVGIRCSKRSVGLIQDLLSKGWEMGKVAAYTPTSLTKLGLR